MLWNGHLPLSAHHRASLWKEEVTMKLLAIDLGKRSFHVYGVDADGSWFRNASAERS